MSAPEVERGEYDSEHRADREWIEHCPERKLIEVKGQKKYSR